ncbi:hypothetical protein PV11_06310 [Exophiala sideris]|uniref:Uncharacterized protein n=1 Tax=Exophiala sideris TaxID=1016849 RepID=A0A0D1WU60_9EURO|nr:hypothetical protein PV11_06310 [Exophiala sideris]
MLTHRRGMRDTSLQWRSTTVTMDRIALNNIKSFREVTQSRRLCHHLQEIMLHQGGKSHDNCPLRERSMTKLEHYRWTDSTFCLQRPLDDKHRNKARPTQYIGRECWRQMPIGMQWHESSLNVSTCRQYTFHPKVCMQVGLP